MYYPQRLGIGLTYFPEIHNFIVDNQNLINVIEIEPQTLWYQINSKMQTKYIINSNIYDKIKSLPQKKIVHSIATPVGGLRSLDLEQVHYLKNTIREFDAHWFSEHLGFNCASNHGREFRTDFFLPPIQNYSGIKNCVNSIKKITDRLRYPFAFETGVNYLESSDEEIPDGEFISSVLERTDCGLILDLHNLWTNELNGRQTVKNFLKSICLERVWEIHLSGGNDDGDYYVDSHRGEIPKKLIEITGEVIDLFPNLSALIFEMSPSYLQKIDYDFHFIRDQMDTLSMLWLSQANNDKKLHLYPDNVCQNNIQDVKRITYCENWENILGSLVLNMDIQIEQNERIVTRLKQDKAIKLINKMIYNIRASNIVSTLRFTTRVLFLSVGAEGLNNLFKNYFKEITPRLFANVEAIAFSGFLQRYYSITWLRESLLIDISILNYNATGLEQKVSLGNNPLKILDNLMNNNIPKDVEEGYYELKIGNEGFELTQ